MEQANGNPGSSFCIVFDIFPDFSIVGAGDMCHFSGRVWGIGG
jgi:hypothetical protein